MGRGPTFWASAPGKGQDLSFLRKVIKFLRWRDWAGSISSDLAQFQGLLGMKRRFESLTFGRSGQ